MKEDKWGIYIDGNKVFGVENFEINTIKDTNEIEYITPEKIEIEGTLKVEYDEKYKCKNCGRHTDSINDFFEERQHLITTDGLCSECSHRKAIINKKLRDME